MVSLMVDMELAEAYVNTQNNLKYHDREEIGKRVLETHRVSEETLDTTLAWYGRNMDDYSRLFDKVDKELEKRRDKYTELPESKLKTDDLWPYDSHFIISPLSGFDSFSFSITNPEMDKGEIIKLSFFMPNKTSLKGTLGVEYSDGFGEGTVSTFSKNKVEIELHTDTSKVVSRIFGTMHVNDIKSLPLYLDSISLKGEPYDTLHYRSKRRLQKTFNPF